MSCSDTIKDIKSTRKEISIISLSEKKSYNEKVNDFIDAMQSFQSILKQKTECIASINEKLEKLTWYTELDDKCLVVILEIIAICKELHSTLYSKYSEQLDKLDNKGIASQEINEFLEEIDYLSEMIADIESTFFKLPNNKKFQQINKELSLL